MMKIDNRSRPKEVSKYAHDRILADIQFALNSVRTESNEFIINDTKWFHINNRGALKPTVVNSATYISKTFQDNLQKRGWTKEKKIKEQQIDGYIDIDTSGAYKINQKSFLKFIQQYCEENTDVKLDKLFNWYYQRYCKKSCFSLPSDLPMRYHHFFHPLESGSSIRIGLEFETGNIASSFRALSKLAFLYQEDSIDAAVFITAKDKKSTATRIWPVSNRNGSFEELEHRNYKRNIIYPIWEFSFAPDGISQNSSYLSSTGKTYKPQNTGKEIDMGGSKYAVYLGEDDREILLPKDTLL